MVVSEQKKEWKLGFPQFSGQRCEAPTDQDVKKMERMERERRSREYNRLAKETLLNIAKFNDQLKERYGLVDVAKSAQVEEKHHAYVNDFVRRVLKGK